MYVCVGALALAAELGFGFLINVLFHCILTAGPYYADSHYYGLIEPNHWEAFPVKQLQKLLNLH